MLRSHAQVAAAGELLQPQSKVSIKGKICKETRPTMHVTCGPTGPSLGDVIGGMSPFQVQKSNTQDSDWCVKDGVILLID